MKFVSLISHKIILNSFLIVVCIFPTISLPNTSYVMTLSNLVMIDAGAIEFEVSIKSVNDNFILTSYQCSFRLSPDIGKDDRLSFTYIEGTSQLTNLPTLKVAINSLDGTSKLTFASLPGLDTITKSSLRVGRFRFHNKSSFINIEPKITWDFEGFVTTILAGETFQNITNTAYHYNESDQQAKLILGKSAQSHVIPNEYKLFQNYPNPFNSTTKIKYTIPSVGTSLMKFVQLKVYDVLGNEVATLVDESQEAGNYEVTFDASQLTSGIYLYRLSAGNFISTKKLILIK